MYIIINWYITGKGLSINFIIFLENVKCLLGKSASPETIQKLTWICFHHSSQILFIDTVRAYTFGIKYLVEVFFLFYIYVFRFTLFFLKICLLNLHMILENLSNKNSKLYMKLKELLFTLIMNTVTILRWNIARSWVMINIFI